MIAAYLAQKLVVSNTASNIVDESTDISNKILAIVNTKLDVFIQNPTQEK